MHALRVAASCSELESPVKLLHLWMAVALTLGVAMPSDSFGTRGFDMLVGVYRLAPLSPD